MREKKNWRKKVYRPAKRGKIKWGLSWIKTRRKIFKRDRFQCQRCGLFFGENGLKLSAHHIIPRKEGGKNKMNNLITLCIECHNYVEMNGFDKLIEGCIFGCKNIKQKSNSLDWRKWVYGSYSKPSCYQ